MKRIHIWIYSMAILAMTDVLLANPITTLNQRLEDTETLVNTQATTLGDAEVASRVSDAVSVDAGALSAQRTELGAEWGELLIAHEMAPLSRGQLTTGDIVQFRSDGMTWNQIMTKYRISPYRLSKALQTDLPTLQTGTVSGTGGQPSASPSLDGRVTDGTNGTGVTNGTNGTDGTSGTDGTDGRVVTMNGDVITRGDIDDDDFTRERGTVSNGQAVGIERNLEASVDRLEADANSRGDGAVADRLASELGVTSDLLHDQRDVFDAEWGELLIAYTLVQQSRSGAVSVGTIFDMRDDGMSWFQIAKSLRVPPGRLMNLIRRGTSDLVGTTIASNGRSGNSKVLKESRRVDAKTIKEKGSTLRQSTKKATGALARMDGTTRKPGGASTLKSAGGSTKMSGATKMGGATRMGGPTTKLGGASVSTMRPTTRMGGGIGGGSATRIQGAAGRGHGRR